MSDPSHTNVEEDIKKIEHSFSKLHTTLVQERDSVFARFPVAFLLLSSFGLVSTFYGFEKVIDQIPYFVENPHMIFIMGVVVLLGTGALYKKLG